MAPGMEPISEYSTSVVRLFSGWAESPIWFSDPVAYEDTRLDPRLVSELRSWDASFYAGLGESLEWRSSGLADSYHRAAERLAQRLAEQLGEDFEVEHDLGEARRRVRAAGPAQNLEAAAAFRDLAARARAEWEELREIMERAKRDGDVFYWSADPPEGRDLSC